MEHQEAKEHLVTNYSTKELVQATREIQLATIPEDAISRQMISNIFESESQFLLRVTGLGMILADALADIVENVMNTLENIEE